MSSLQDNPFSVQSPERMTAQQTYDLFVDVFTDFYKVLTPGHTFVHGSRGSGKSMMFRYMRPDCQLIAKKCSLKELDFFGVHVPIKTTDLKLTELARLPDYHANVFLNEHFMCIHIAGRIFLSMVLLDELKSNKNRDELLSFIYGTFISLIVQCGWEGATPVEEELESTLACLAYLQKTCDIMYASVKNYFKRLTPEPSKPYQGALCGYLDFLVPLLSDLRKVSFMPSGPVYLMLDDADNLNLTQTMILNSWVSTRTQEDVCLKISTQLNYKTYRTISGENIETPHDFQEIDLSTVYTTPKNNYHRRLRDIVEKRFVLAKIVTTPEEFFPHDEKQETKIKEIGERIKQEWTMEKKGFRPRDDVARYARPTFMAELEGTSKSGSSYSYSGFNQLVHLSSGVVRHFLHPASLMYSKQRANSGDEVIKYITPTIQDEVVRDEANELMFKEFDRIKAGDIPADNSGDTKITSHNIQRLENIIRALGGTFHTILLSNRSERKVFSIAFSDNPDTEVLEVLSLGVRYGYFHESSIGNKEGTGRTRLYVLTRRLAPFFKLDPSSFAGYLFVTNRAMREAMENPNRMLRTMKQMTMDKYLADNQLELKFPEEQT